MADQISALSATWTPGVGVSLGWDPPPDVTVDSIYILSFIDTSAMFPAVTQFATIQPNVVKAAGSSATMLAEPSNDYTVPWSLMEMWAAAGRIPTLLTGAPAAATFSITHVDNSLEANVADPGGPVAIMALPQSLSSNVPTHLANSFTLDNTGQFFANKQDSYEEIRDSVAVLVGTIVGQRNLVPDYGVEDMVMTQIDPNNITSAVAVWENRAQVAVSVSYDDTGDGNVNIQLQSPIGE